MDSGPRPSAPATAIAAERVLSQLSSPVWVYDLDGERMLWANPAAVGFWQAGSLAELLSRDFRPASVANRERLQNYRARMCAGDSLEETWTLYPRGSASSVQCRISPHPLPEHGMAMMVEVRQVLDQQALPAERRALESFRHTGLLTLMIDGGGQVLNLNPAAESRLDAARLGDGWASLFLEQARAQQLLQQAMADGSARDELSLWLGGSLRHHGVDLRRALDPVTAATVVVVNLSDLSERRHLELQLRDYGDGMRRALEFLPVPLLILAADRRRLLFVNAAIRQWLGEPSRAGEQLAAPFATLTLAIAAAWREAEGFDGHEAVIDLQDRAPLQVRLSGAPIFFDGHAAIVVSAIDIADARRAQQALNTALDQERQINALQRQLLSVVTHELRTPIAVVDSSIQRLQRSVDTLGGEQIKERLAQLRATVGRLTQLAQRLLDAAQIDNGGIGFRPELLDLAALVERVVRQHRGLGAAPIELVIDPLAGEFYGDASLLEQVFNNLIDNAIKYSPGGTPLRVRFTGDARHRCIQVIDQGIGIPLAEQARIFDRFFRASNTLRIRGTGLGLHISQQLVQLHGGHIELRSAPGQGSCFSVYLPLNHSP